MKTLVNNHRLTACSVAPAWLRKGKLLVLQSFILTDDRTEPLVIMEVWAESLLMLASVLPPLDCTSW